MTHRAVIEAGPAAICRLCCDAAQSIDSKAALEWIDDPVGLVAGRPVVISELLGRVLQCPQPVATLEIIHPSWWPLRRVELLRTAGLGITDEVVTRTRSAVLAAGAAGTVVIEIADGLVAVAAEPELTAEPRIGPPDAVADAVAGRVAAVCADSRRSVLIDAPAEVGGAAVLAELITARLPPGLRVRMVDGLPAPGRDGDVSAGVAGVVGRARCRPRRLSAAAAAVIALLAFGLHHDAVPETVTPAPYVVADRVAVQVPAGWLPRRVTGGPGSARVEVVSPVDPQLVLHITQAPAPGDTLAAVAEPLQRGLLRAETAAPGVFVGFDPAGTSAGRSAVTYREVRAGHQTDWAVLVDGAVRIGIGCQRGPEASAVLRAACEQAVRSAHAIG